jgi:hypothetical protein
LGCNAVWFEEGWTFWRNILLESSGLKSRLSKKPSEAGSKLKMDIICTSKCLAVSKLIDVITQKTVFFIVATIRTSNTTFVFCVSE